MASKRRRQLEPLAGFPVLVNRNLVPLRVVVRLERDVLVNERLASLGAERTQAAAHDLFGLRALPRSRCAMFPLQAIGQPTGNRVESTAFVRPVLYLDSQRLR